MYGHAREPMLAENPVDCKPLVTSMTLRFLALIALAITAFLSSSPSVSSSSDLRDVPRCKRTHDVAQTSKVRAYQCLAIEAQSERSPRVSTLSNDVFDASPFPANDALQKDHVLLFGRVEFNVYRLWSSFGSNFGDILEISYQRPSLISRTMLEHKWCLHYKSGTKVARASSCFLLSETKEKTDSNAIAGETLVKESEQ